MSGKSFNIIKKTMPLVAAVLLMTGLCVGQANAQFGAPMPPPIGDGASPAPVNPGDTGASPAVPSGQADPTPGHNFPTGAGRDRSVIYIYKQSQGGAMGVNRGERMVMTIRPDTLPQDAYDQIAGILGVNGMSGEQAIAATATDAQLEQISEALAPYPQAQNNGGRKVINSDSPNAAYPKANHESIYAFDGPLPTVQTFCRYLVILGVVAATIWMSIAAYSVVMGHPYGGARVFGAAAGLMMLLCGYTIWKIVQMNTFDANSADNATPTNRTQTAQVQDAFMTRPNVPGIPGGGGGAPPRSGIPVIPFGNSGNP